MKIKEDFVSIENTKIDYVMFGKGEKPLILIPGLSLKDVKGNGMALAYMYRNFGKDYKVYCIDRKREIPENYTVEEIANDYAFAMKALQIKKACILGISQGGMIAQYITLNHPELVSRLALGVTLSRNNDTAINCVNHWISLGQQNKFGELSIDILTKMYSDAYIRKYQALFPILTKLSKPKNPKRFVTLAKACLTCNTYERLQEIKCPVLVIGGKQDRVLSGEASIEIAQKLGCELVMYDDLGHGVYEEGKDFNNRIIDFFMK